MSPSDSFLRSKSDRPWPVQPRSKEAQRDDPLISQAGRHPARCFSDVFQGGLSLIYLAFAGALILAAGLFILGVGLIRHQRAT